MTDEAKALAERLRAKYTVTDEFSTIRRPVNPDGHEAADLIETQAREIERLREALSQWLTKTEWVVQTGQKHELGMHRADMLRNRIERQAAEIDWLKSPGKWEQIAETESSQVERDAAAELASLLWRTFPAFAQTLRDNPSITASFFVRHDEAVRAPLLGENERLREALQFYARENSWKCCGMYMSGRPNPSSAEIDRGSKARAALAGDSHE